MTTKREKELRAALDKALEREGNYKAQLREGIAAIDAFEQYCHTYAKHDISPRLKEWRTFTHYLLKPQVTP